jgi:hypothetical protein
LPTPAADHSGSRRRSAASPLRTIVACGPCRPPQAVRFAHCAYDWPYAPSSTLNSRGARRSPPDANLGRAMSGVDRRFDPCVEIAPTIFGKVSVDHHSTERRTRRSNAAENCPCQQSGRSDTRGRPPTIPISPTLSKTSASQNFDTGTHAGQGILQRGESVSQVRRIPVGMN